MKKTYYLIIINKTNGLQDVEVGFSQQDVELVEKTKLKDQCFDDINDMDRFRTIFDSFLGSYW